MEEKKIFNQVFYKRNSCRICAGKNLELALKMGDSPISEKYLTKEKISENIPKVPLDLYFCKDCTHVQLLHIVKPEYLWADFTFKTSRDEKLINHFNDVVSRILKVKNIDKNDLILDVGSNDGTLLKCFSEKGFKNILGIDPASHIVKQANKNGIPTIEGYMNSSSAQKILSKYGSAKIITANNVFAHADDLQDMLKSIKLMMENDSIFVFEVSYLLDVVQKMLIGTIFHEHLSYHSVKTLKYFFDFHEMELIHIERGPEQGGSIIGYAQKKEGSIKNNFKSVEVLLNLEKEFGLDNIEKITEMNEKLISIKENLNKIIADIKKEKKTISGFGAARAGTTFLSYFEIGKYIDYLFDDNKDKHYKFSPGDKIEVLPTSEIEKTKPNYLIIFAWIHADKIIKNNQKFLNNGGSFIRFYPKIELIKKIN